jgi:parallel beta-helix repeat protein
MKNRAIILLAILMTSCILIVVQVKPAGAVAGPMRGLWHFDEGAGTAVYDSSGWNNDGTVYGGAVWTDGKAGKALDFDGVDDYVEVPDSDSLDVTGKITLEAWICPRNVSKNAKIQVIVAKYNHSENNGAYYLGLGGYGYKNKILLGLSNDGYHYYYMLSNTNITANTWTHVTATSNGTHMILYINQIKDNVQTYSPGVIHASTAPLRIGCYLPELGFPRFFDGVIDEVKVSATTIWTVDDDRVQCPTADFTNIQPAINAASSGDTIYVYDGTYNENLAINKALTIQAASRPVIDGGAAGDCISISANNVIISGFDIRNGYNGIGGQTSGSTFSNNVIHDNLNIPGSAGIGILLWGDNDNNTIIGNEICSNDRQGIFIGYSDFAGETHSKISTGNLIDNNKIYNNGLYRYENGPDASTYGIELWCADDNVIQENEVYGHDDWFPYGGTFDFAQGIYLCDSHDNDVMNNYLHGNNYGVGLWHPARALANNYINYNNISGNTGYGICNYDGIQVDARFNWWGDASGPNQTATNPTGLGDRVSDYVDYSPWLGDPFEVTPRTYHVNPTGTIQEAIDEASPSDTIIVHDGIYSEALHITKSLSIEAASKPVIKGSQSVTTNYGSRDAVIFVEDAAYVAIVGFDIEGEGLGSTNPKSYAVIYENSGGIIKDCMVSPNTINDMNGVAIAEWDSSNSTIDSCTIKNFGRIGIFYYDGCGGGVYNSTIEGQVYNDENYVNYGIEIESWSCPCNIEIIGNEICNCDNVHPSPLWSSAGIVIDGWLGYYAVPSSTVVIELNEIHDNYYGIEVVANPYSYAHYNNIYDNREYGIIQDADYAGNNATFDATFNWWGHETGPYHETSWMYMGSPYGPHYGLGDNVSDYVLYDPWLECPWPAPPPTISVDPQVIQAQMLNKTFSINITINDLSVGYKAVGMQFRLCYNNTLLQFVNVTQGPFMKDTRWNLEGTWFISIVEDDPIYGPNVLVGMMLWPNSTGYWNAYPSGSGVLATITFKIIYQERGLEKPPLTCGLTLNETMIINDEIKEVPHNLLHGLYEIYPTNIGDINYDGKVDMKDIGAVARAFGEFPGRPRWNPAYDINGDNKIDMRDIATVARNFGWTPTYDP